jgi:hypothetical protein
MLKLSAHLIHELITCNWPCDKLSSRVTVPSRLPKPVNENRTGRDRLSALRKQIRFYRPYWKAQ